MLSMDQIQCELKAIEEFNAVFLAETEAGKEVTLEDALGYIIRQARKQELRWVLRRPRSTELTGL